jgi:hypothetical protein
MKKTTIHRKTTIDPAHDKPSGKSVHNREQLRRRLLKMILQNEAQRRSTTITAGRMRSSGGSGHAAAKLSVFDPEDIIGKELAASDLPQKPA